jgi:hypothetical protein
MKTRRFVIAAALFAMGCIVYLYNSRAPLRVHVVTIPTELATMLVVTYFAAVVNRSPWQRVGGAVAGVAVVSVVGTWLWSKVIGTFTPLDPIYFVMDLGASFLKATTFIGIVWLIDFAIDQVRNRTTEPTER